MTPAEIGNIGERHVEAWLTAKGYICNRNTQLPGSTDIEANSAQGNILVQVKTAVAPEPPADMSADERANIKARATRTNRKAYLAQVMITPGGLLGRDIYWTELK